uniref:Lipocalin-2 1 n=1 Tax=Amblyomma tuberculatum TaxID=48802 RepID=A0A6M2E495_9ACAR
MDAYIAALVLALIVPTYALITTKADLKEALGTKERVWTVLRNFDRQHTCVYAWNGTLTEDDYEFEQYYKDKEGRNVQHHLHGSLSDDASGAVLTVSHKKGGEPNIPYTLKYWNSNQKCGFLTFTDKNGEVLCEVHVWEENLATGTKFCEQLYEEICGFSAGKYEVTHSGCYS